MDDNDLAGVLAAYRSGKKFDLAQSYQGGKWGGFWALPPCSPPAMQTAVRQFLRERAERLRYIRRARLGTPTQTFQTVIITILPDREQWVYDIETGKRLVMSSLFCKIVCIPSDEQRLDQGVNER